MNAVIVVPCFNEAARLSPEKFLSFAAARPGLAFLFVDDGSGDGTAGVIEDMVRRAPPGSVRSLRLADNQGKGEAVRRGLLAALETGAEAVGYWDADLSTPLDAVARFMDILDGDPSVVLVMGVRRRAAAREMERHPLRHLFGRLFGLAANKVLGLAFYDTQCGAKLFRAGAGVGKLLAAPFHSRWIFDIEILLRLRRDRGPGWAAAVREVPLEVWRNVPPSRVGWLDFAKGPWELLHLRRLYGRA